MICNNIWPCSEHPSHKFDWCSECRTDSTDSNITRIERKKRYNLLNPDHKLVTVFKVDGGVIHDEPNQPACDYLYVTHREELRYAIFVELKGNDIPHALEQITKTIEKLINGVDKKAYCIKARIICRAVPNITTREVIQCKKYLKSKYGVELAIRSNTMDDNVLKE